MVVHIVLFRLRPDVTPTQRETFITQLRGLLGHIPELRSMDVAEDEVGSERSATFGLYSTFDDMDGLRRYQQHPDHQAVAAPIVAACEWVKSWDYTRSTS